MTRSSRFLGFALMCISAQAGAQGPSAAIEWSAERKLAITDFKGKAPGRATDGSRSYVAIDVSWGCERGTPSSTARALFDPDRSWWRDESPIMWQSAAELPVSVARDDGERALLAHEQLHFDLTELSVRKLRRLFETLPTVCRTPGSAPGVDKEVADIEKEWQAEQFRYDRETDHGLNRAKQKTWADATARALATH